MKYRSLFLLAACLFAFGLTLNGCSLLPGKSEPVPAEDVALKATPAQLESKGIYYDTHGVTKSEDNKNRL